MPTFDTPNSTDTYTVPSGATYLELVELVGGAGGEAGGDTGGSGGGGGQISGLLPVSPVEGFTIHTGGDGGDGDGNDGGAGGQSPLANGGAGGDNFWSGGGAGGGGGAPSALIRDADSATVALGEGGGGGGGSGGGGDIHGSGGGGGARGGSGGSGDPDSTNADAGDDAEGTGSGGDGGNGSGVSGPPGEDGGTITHGDLQTVTTGASSAGPTVTIEARFPPAAPGNLQATDVREREIDLAWTDDDSQAETSPETGVRVHTSRDGGSSWTQQADLAADTTAYTIQNLRNGEQYHIQVEAYNDYGTASGPTLLAASGQTVTEDSPTSTSWHTQIQGEYQTEDN